MNRSVPKETLKMERDYMRPDKLQITCTKTDGVSSGIWNTFPVF